MPELPDVEAYIHALDLLIKGQPIEAIRLGSPFLLRTVEPSLEDAEGRTVVKFKRIGKRIAIGLDNDIWLVIHLMIAGRLHWRKPGVKLSGRNNLVAFDFANGSLLLTEAGNTRRASLHVIGGEHNLVELDRGGIEVFSASAASFKKALTAENRTLKRALTDPHIISGVGNAYSDEILHAAQLSPTLLTQKLTDEQWEKLFDATRTTLKWWIDKLCKEAETKFPEKVTAFRPEMAVHGRFDQPCKTCGAPIQRIRYADNETNYCANCQTGGKLLADRGLSRVLKSDWPRTLDELEGR